MKTVVEFSRVPSKHAKGRNKVHTRTLRKIGFVEDRYSDEEMPYPAHGELWLVTILRENLSDRGGCFVLRPEKKLDEEEVLPLITGMYDLELVNDTVVVTPVDTTRYWAMSDSAKKSIQDTFNTDGQYRAKSLVISQGGEVWSRRPPPENIVEREAEKLLRG